MTDNEDLGGIDLLREALATGYAEIATQVSCVAMPLGKWAGRGDGASFSEDARDGAGLHALSELDTAIARLTSFRERLAHALERP